MVVIIYIDISNKKRKGKVDTPTGNISVLEYVIHRRMIN